VNSVLILGSGVAGLSASYHLGHERCLILEKNPYKCGHCRSFDHLGAVWDEGPHVSFTKHAYVQELFEKSVKGELHDFAPIVSNWFAGHWITHPAQSNLYQVPEPIRSECVDGFLALQKNSTTAPSNYGEWLSQSLGSPFRFHFSDKYTRKYWTVEPEAMGIDWIGGRVHRPDIEDVLAGSRGPRDESAHYIKKIRYPRKGGFQSFLQELAMGANVKESTRVVSIDLEAHRVRDESGATFEYDTLVNTIPLPEFVQLCEQAAPEMVTAAKQLACTQLYLVNVVAPHKPLRPENWIYVYDESMLATRITVTDSLAASNAAPNTTGIQVEVYASRFKPLPFEKQSLIERVIDELIEMGLVDAQCRSSVKAETMAIPYANIIFTKETASALETIWSRLEAFGLCRESDDLNPITDWQRDRCDRFGSLMMAGRFGQWKYYWSDDCVLRGAAIGSKLSAAIDDRT
jgi:protoporphyrinogen oxidase